MHGSIDDGEDGDIAMIVSPEVGEASKTCFIALPPTRRFFAPLVPSACQLCPSMDLMILGLRGGSLTLHRTIVPQKLATISLAAETAADVDAGPSSNTSHQAFCAGFRPDGRVLAVCSSASGIHLYPLEKLLASDSTGVSDSLDAAEGSDSMAVALPDDDTSPIITLHWAHMGNPHPIWEMPSADQDAQVYWKYTSRFCDQSTVLLPPSEYHNPQHAPDLHHATSRSTSYQSAQDAAIQSVFPASNTPLSVLCLVSLKRLHIYLHGCLHILSAPLQSVVPQTTAVDVVVSHNLSHIVLYPRGTKNIVIYTLPELTLERYTLQRMSALSCALLSHVKTIRTKVHEILASWKSSLRPLDIKLDLLTNLLFKYGLHGSTTAYLVQYILSGHTRAAPSLANVMDQFFTHVQMNDQLLVRMESSLSAAVQNVETQFRKNLLSPAQAMLFQAKEMVGLAIAHSHETNDNVPLLRTVTAETFNQVAASLYLVTEAALTDLVDARFRLRDFCAWLRSVGSQIKAEGTALNSVQRQNAKSRRVSDAVVERMLEYLQTKEVVASGVTEIVLGLRVSRLLNEANNSIPGSPIETGSDADMLGESSGFANERIGSIPELVEMASKALDKILEEPQRSLKRSVRTTSLALLGKGDSPLVAVTIRLGMGGSDRTTAPFGENELDGFFSPYEAGQMDVVPVLKPTNFYEWCIVAEAVCEAHGDAATCIRLSAVPLSHMGLSDKQASRLAVPSDVFWSTCLQLPTGCTILELAFYGDDGKSSLSSGQDSGSGKDRRQSLGLLISRESEQGLVTEFWLVVYDDCLFASQALVQESPASLGLGNDLPVTCVYTVQPLCESAGFYEEQSSTREWTIFARSRMVHFDHEDSKPKFPRLMLSGSRGVGALLGETFVELYDLEEDQDDDEDQEDFDEEENVVRMAD